LCWWFILFLSQGIYVELLAGPDNGAIYSSMYVFNKAHPYSYTPVRNSFAAVVTGIGLMRFESSTGLALLLHQSCCTVQTALRGSIAVLRAWVHECSL
jgi:hypothetical protein